MTKTILSLAAAAAIGTAGLAAAPQPAHAVAWWIAPAIIGGVVAGAAVGAAATNANAQFYGYDPAPGGTVYVRPAPRCSVVRERMPDGAIRRVRICD